MNRMKKLASVVLAGVLTLAMSTGVFATAGITAQEQTILDTAKAKAIELGVNVDTSAKYKEYVSQATTYLVKNELSQAQVDAMVKAVEDAAATAQAEMKEKGVTKLSDLTTEDFTKLYDAVGAQITAAAKAVGIVVKKTADGYAVEDVTTVSEDKSEDKSEQKADTYVQTNSVIKQTGAQIADVEMSAATVDTAADMTSTVVISVLFVGAVVVCGVVAKKKNLFSNVEA